MMKLKLVTFIVRYVSCDISHDFILEQILHSEKRVGVAKADSAHAAIERCCIFCYILFTLNNTFLNSLNSLVKVSTHCVLLNSSNVPDIIDKYPIIY